MGTAGAPERRYSVSEPRGVRWWGPLAWIAELSGYAPFVVRAVVVDSRTSARMTARSREVATAIATVLEAAHAGEPVRAPGAGLSTRRFTVAAPIAGGGVILDIYGRGYSECAATPDRGLADRVCDLLNAAYPHQPRRNAIGWW